MKRDNPCFANDCHRCCLNTRMTLTEADAARLEVSGCRDFFFVNDDQDLQLTNEDGHCIFLVDSRCSVHDPWAKEFTFTQDDTVQLRRSVTDEESENRNRAARGSRRGPSGQA
ncbi:MAG: YkgJ family cysteine cluster protein [Acidobacteria bacterium]|nr:YkgJ family cysteine cluster protein [Candidatus Sulfomarinibacter kjeldsenii]